MEQALKKQFHSLAYRDGTGQDQRGLRALAPDYVKLDERTQRDWLQFAYKLAAQLRFFTENDVAPPRGQAITKTDWTNFLRGYSREFEQLGLPDLKDAFWENWLNDIMAYIDDPQSFLPDEEKFERLSRPHLALFLGFLKIMENVSGHLNQLTKRHIDFYYKDILGMTPKAAIPDQAQVVFDLAEEEQQFLVPKGTLLEAGTDADGVQLVYGTDKDVVINHAKVADIKTVYIERDFINVQEARLRNQDEPDKGFMKMMEHALGENGPGTPLPAYPEQFSSLDEMFAALTGDDVELGEAADAYIQDKLFLTLPNFTQVFMVKLREDNADIEVEEVEWEAVYPILEQAYGLRERDYRKVALVEEMRSVTDDFIGFNRMIRLALGEPGAGDPLPPFGGREGDVDEVLSVLNGTNPTRNTAHWFSLATAYVAENLLMSEAEFRLLMHVRDSDDIELHPNFSDVVGILERAEQAKRNLGLLKPEREDWVNIYRTTNAWQAATIQDPSVPFSTPGWSTFGEGQASKAIKTAEPAGIGLAFSAPLLELSEGTRIVTITIDCSPGGYEAENLKEVLRNTDDAGKPVAPPFECFFTGANGWFKSNTIAADPGVFVMGERGIPCFATADAEVQNVILDTSITVPESKLFSKDDEGEFLLFEDGRIFRIDTLVTETTVQVALEATTEPRVGTYMLRPDQIIPVNGPSAGQKFEFTDAGDGTPIGIAIHLDVDDEGETIVTATRNDGGAFAPADTDKLLLHPDGTVYRIVTIVGEVDAECRIEANWLRYPSVYKLTEEAIFFNGLRFKIGLTASDLPVVAPQVPLEGWNEIPEWPVLRLMLRDNNVQIRGIDVAYSPYPHFEQLIMERMRVEVDVHGLLNLDLYADDTTVSAKKPFNPFGFDATSGSRLLFWHREIISKKLDELGLSMEWLDAPSDFKAHLANYWKVNHYWEQELKAKADGVELTTTPLPENEYVVQGNDYFKAQLALYDQNVFLKVVPIELFFDEDATKVNLRIVRDLPDVIKMAYPNYHYQPHSDLRQEDEVLDRTRFFQLELGATGFFGPEFARLTNIQTYSNNTEVQELLLEDPYIPKLKTFAVNYTSHLDVQLSGADASDDHLRLYHHLPFGYLRIEGSSDISKRFLLPQFDFQGEFYIGLEQLEAPQVLSLLFKMSDGTASPATDPPAISWSYLKANQWKEITGAKILSDGTNGLLNTGIMEFLIPGDISLNNSIMPGNLHWVRASVSRDAEGVSDTVDVQAQAVNATFIDQGNSKLHLEKALPSGSITTTNDGLPEISAIQQPYVSQKGKPEETETDFYLRVSERLRHKNRALTIWDYERLVLEHFSNIYKVKCLPAELTQNWEDLGSVSIIVIPDIRGVETFQGETPKVSASQINDIRNYLEQLMPAFAELTVKNPTYVLVKARFAVKFNKGYSPSYYESVLQEDLRRFLSPWAFEEAADIVLGGNIYANVLVNFMAELPYVDYIANMKLYQSYDGKTFTDSSRLNDTQNAVTARSPDEILVSALEHEIDIITDRGYFEDDFSGINYMRIGLDFLVTPDPVLTNNETDTSDSGGDETDQPENTRQ